MPVDAPNAQEKLIAALRSELAAAGELITQLTLAADHFRDRRDAAVDALVARRQHLDDSPEATVRRPAGPVGPGCGQYAAFWRYVK